MSDYDIREELRTSLPTVYTRNIDGEFVRSDELVLNTVTGIVEKCRVETFTECIRIVEEVRTGVAMKGSDFANHTATKAIGIIVGLLKRIRKLI